jgi:hypothetical protein
MQVSPLIQPPRAKKVHTIPWDDVIAIAVDGSVLELEELWGMI